VLGAAGFDVQLSSHFLHEPGQRAGFFALAGLLGGFLFIRTSARMIRAQVSWWPGNVQTSSGLHIHHLVWGIVTMMLCGFLGFAIQPHGFWLDLVAALFGIGAGLTLDEFALWLHLDDVYWTEEGRSSIDAVIVAATIGGLIVAGAAPFDTGDGSSISTILGAVLVNLAFVAVAATKGKLFVSLIGAFLPVFAVTGAVRLAKPRSRWAKRRYSEGSHKLAEAVRRQARESKWQRRFFDAIGGTPTD
jgi:hypothetical protein